MPENGKQGGGSTNTESPPQKWGPERSLLRGSDAYAVSVSMSGDTFCTPFNSAKAAAAAAARDDISDCRALINSLT